MFFYSDTHIMLDLLPDRETKPRKAGVSMVMDKGLGIRQAEDLAETAGHLIDFLKLGFGTSYVSNKASEKVKCYRQHQMKVFVGGTLLEAFLLRDQLDAYLRYVNKLGCDTIEVSDGSIKLPHDEKCRLIERLAGDFTVLSEVGAKNCQVSMDADSWAACMQKELEAGSSFVIAEARESGTVGIYGKEGAADEGLIQSIINEVSSEKVIWEAPLKKQQVWFIKTFGANVNLGNIAPAEIVALETLRVGLRGDTLFDFLPEKLKQYKL